MHFKLIIIFCGSLISVTAFAQAIDNGASYRMQPAKRSIRFQYDNDYFSESDEYYTQGMNLEWISPGLKKNPLARLLIMPEGNTNGYGLAIEHNAYTPTTIRSAEIRYGDRPFAASLMVKTIGASYNSARGYRITSSFVVGMIGPVAGAQQIQKTIHSWINGTDPQGWQNQIRNDLIVNYESAFEKNVIQGKYFLLNGFAQGRMGTLSTKFSIGCTLMLGKLNSDISNAFLGIAPSLQKQKFSFHIYLQPTIGTIAYDGTLNGGLIFNRESPYVIGQEQIEKFTFQANAGVVFAIKSTYLEYFQSTITKEFTTGGHHSWGGLRIGYLF
jgi:hypothetical protein